MFGFRRRKIAVVQRFTSSIPYGINIQVLVFTRNLQVYVAFPVNLKFQMKLSIASARKGT